MAGQGIGAFIGRSQHKGIETVPDRQYVAFVNACAAAAGFYVIDIIVGKRHHFIQIAVFQHNQSSQYLSDTGRIIRLVHILSV